MASTRDPRNLQVIDPILTNVALAYRPGNFIYDQIVARQTVSEIAGQYPIWSQEDLMRDPGENKVADRAETPEIDLSYSLGNYFLEDYRLKVSITPRERSQAASELRMETMKVHRLLDAMALRREVRLANKLRKTSNGGKLTLGAGVSTKWDASSGATIEKDIKAARKAVWDATGQHVDTILMNWDVAYSVALDASVREILKYTVNGKDIIELGDRMLPSTLHGLNVVVAGGSKINSAKRGAAAAYSDIWGDNVRLLRRGVDEEWGNPATVYSLRGPVNGTEQPSTNRTAETGGEGFLVDRWATPDPPIDYIRAWECVEEKVVAPDIAYEIADVLT